MHTPLWYNGRIVINLSPLALRGWAFYYLELVIFYNFVSLGSKHFPIYTFRRF